MDSIDIRKPHALTLRQARGVLDELAAGLAERHGAGYRWEGDSLRFSRFGLRGVVHLLPGEIHLRMELGLIFLSVRDKLRRRIEAFLDDHATVTDPKAVAAALRRAASVGTLERPAPPRRRRARAPAPAPAPAPARDAPSPVLTPAHAKSRSAPKDHPPEET